MSKTDLDRRFDSLERQLRWLEDRVDVMETKLRDVEYKAHRHDPY